MFWPYFDIFVGLSMIRYTKSEKIYFYSLPLTREKDTIYVAGRVFKKA